MSDGHAHHHHHHHHHHHGPAPGERPESRWLIGIGLNAAFVAVEVGAGLYGHSMSLLADAGHNLSDVLALALSAAAAWLAARPGWRGGRAGRGAPMASARPRCWRP